MKALFVTGTDTGVGKTVVAAGIARLLYRRGLKIGVLKPVETGCEPGRAADGALLAEAAGLADDAVAATVPITYRQPLAPLVAARQEGRPIDLDRLDAAWQSLAGHDWVIVEGAGGLSVPISHDLDMAGLAGRWRLPLLVVARPGLGTLNHTFLTVHYGCSRGLAIVGVVISGWPAADPDPSLHSNPAMIEELCEVPVLGIVPWHHPMVTADDAAAAVARSTTLERLLRSTKPLAETRESSRPCQR